MEKKQLSVYDVVQVHRNHNSDIAKGYHGCLCIVKTPGETTTKVSFYSPAAGNLNEPAPELETEIPTENLSYIGQLQEGFRPKWEDLQATA